MGEEVETARGVAEQLNKAIWIANFHGRSEAVIFSLAKATLQQTADTLERVERERDQLDGDLKVMAQHANALSDLRRAAEAQVEALRKERDEEKRFASECSIALIAAEARSADLGRALTDVRAAIMEHAPDTLWVSLIETAVDSIDAALAGSTPESSGQADGRPPGDTPWKRFRDEKPTHDGWGERYLLTWNVRSATYDTACVDGEWRVGEEIDGHADDLWCWLDVNPERHLPAAAAAADVGSASLTRDA